MEEVSGIFARHQRLIYKGKLLAKGASMAEAKLKDGSKVMLMASSSTATQVGLLCVISVMSTKAFGSSAEHQPSKLLQGQIAAQEVTEAKAAEARERARLLIDAKDRKAALMQASASLDSSWQVGTHIFRSSLAQIDRLKNGSSLPSDWLPYHAFVS